MSHSILEYLDHIYIEASYLHEKSKNLSFDEFIPDETLKRAFLRSLEIIGEASKNIPESFKKITLKLNGEVWQVCVMY
jgi:uncharacterized protein with HEPN domain